ncbi:hypothetical protein MTR_3g105520 [Medicago truncatula]|uniref:Transmembrane protein n=1 Tax=Medicago truncatula TaxID=3880 RepID=G7J958_MEDTR|nr:hypothetical protein MTR_3g105520 [Medicago truncatula]
MNHQNHFLAKIFHFFHLFLPFFPKLSSPFTSKLANKVYEPTYERKPNQNVAHTSSRCTFDFLINFMHVSWL